MAEQLGAIRYVETSAIEQSGFTDCFNTAVCIFIQVLTLLE